MSIRALIFDFDGLILDTETPGLQAWQEIYAEHGCEFSISAYLDCLGRPSGHFDAYGQLAALWGREIDRDAIRARKRARATELTADQPVRPGVLDYVREARGRGLQLAVASSADRPWVCGHLERLGLVEHFACIRCVEDTQEHKPHPAPYLAVLEALKLAPHEAIAFEDAPHGVASAKAAGIFAVAVPNTVTASLDLSIADLRLNSMAELPLPELLQKVNGNGRRR